MERAAATSRMPMTPGNSGSRFLVDGRPIAEPGNRSVANYRAVSTDYFRTMGIPVLEGREFTDRDSKNALPVVVVNEAFARRCFPGEDPVVFAAVAGLLGGAAVAASVIPAWRAASVDPVVALRSE